MPNTVVLSLPIKPMAKQSFRYSFKNGRQIKYQDTTVLDYSARIKYMAKTQLPPNFKMMEGPIGINPVIFCYEYLKSMKHFKYNDNPEYLRNYIGKPTKPDIDNLLKMLLDCLQGVVYSKDSLIMGVCAFKVYGERDNIYIKIHEANSCKYPSLNLEVVNKWHFLSAK